MFHHLAVDEGPLLFILETLFMFDPQPIHPPLPVFFKLDLTKFEHFYQILTGCEGGLGECSEFHSIIPPSLSLPWPCLMNIYSYCCFFASPALVTNRFPVTESESRWY